MRPTVPEVHITDRRDEEFAAYRAMTGQAVAGLIFGLLAPLALLDPLLWLMPALGLLFSYWALRRIKKNPQALTGRGMALTGMTLALLFAVAAPTEWLVYRAWARGEARQIAELWFQYILQNEPHKAHQLTFPPQHRQPFDGRLWDFYRNNPRMREGLQSYTAHPTARALLTLGPKARVRFYDTTAQTRSDQEDFVEQLYAVTYEEDGERKSFFVAVKLLRPKPAEGRTGWRIVSAEGGVLPEGWKRPEARPRGG